jgi:hypothetical protein
MRRVPLGTELRLVYGALNIGTRKTTQHSFPSRLLPIVIRIANTDGAAG